MPSVNRLSLLFILSALAALAACGGGGGSHVNPTPPPSGGFTPADLQGTYVFSTSGADSTTNGDPLAMVGTFAANGSGGITGGTVDMNDTGFSAPVQGLAITGGSYILTSDGRVQVSLSTATATPFGTSSIVLDLVLTSKSHGSVTEFDANGSGSGTLDLQNSATLSGSYAFSLSGIDTSLNPLATVGSFTLGSGGAITGVQDFNDAGPFTSLPLSGSVALGASGAPGTATLTTTGAFGSLTFDVYAVDSTHLKFIQTGGATFLTGDAFAQTGAALPTTATTFAFTMSGQASSGPIAAGGLLAIDGAGNISGDGIDINDGGTVTSSTITGGSYLASGSVGGRTVFTPSGFAVATSFVAYPTATAGLQILENDGVSVLVGTAYAQTTPVPSLQASQGYAMGLSAMNSNGEEDDIAEFTTTSSGFSGIIDINDQGSTNPDQQFSGSYTLDSPATGRGELTINSNSGVNGIFYAVDGSTLLFLETDSNQVGTGIFELQSAGAQGAIATQHALVVPRPVLHANRRQKK